MKTLLIALVSAVLLLQSQFVLSANSVLNLNSVPSKNAVLNTRTVSLTGTLTTESGHAIANVSVNINSLTTFTNAQGQYQLTLPEKRIYLLKMKKLGFYPTVQSFSHNELNLALKNTVTLSAITLVEKQKNRVMLAFGGDVMMARRFHKPYFGDAVLIRNEHREEDSKALLQYVKPYMSIADFAAVNLETQILVDKPEQRAKKSVTFYSPPETLTALSWAGIDYVTLGNNHTFDYLNEGMTATLRFLKASKLAFSGAGLNQQQALSAYHRTINNTPLAMLGYVGWQGGFSPNQTASNDKGGAAYGSMENIKQSVKREIANKQVPIVQYHGSQEYSDNPTGVTEQRLKSALDQGAALAIAHHPHVSQGLELYNNKLIAYSMGNFVFDQYFAETPHSFILYVWLDAGKFHRAEIVPIYLKGYQPTPATGLHRRLTMNRLKVLSEQRATYLSTSGGHGVITSNNKKRQSAEKKNSLRINKNEQLVSLVALPWHQQITQIKLPPNDMKYRLGTNLVNGSDFESFANFDSDERGWFFNRKHTQWDNIGANSQHSLAITLNKNVPQPLGMQSFRRVYKASSPMTISAKIKVQDTVKIKFYWQGRKKSQKFFAARETGKKHLIETVTLNAADAWQALAIEFNSPRIGYRSFRVIAEIESTAAATTQVNIDDFSVIEWQTAYSNNPSPLLFNLQAKQASHLGINSKDSAEIMITTK